MRIVEYVVEILGTFQPAAIRFPIERAPIAISVGNEVDFGKERKKIFLELPATA
jgi:hypothetical protein